MHLVTNSVLSVALDVVLIAGPTTDIVSGNKCAQNKFLVSLRLANEKSIFFLLQV